MNVRELERRRLFGNAGISVGLSIWILLIFTYELTVFEIIGALAVCIFGFLSLSMAVYRYIR